VVLDSVVPPQLNLLEGFWPNAAAGYRALFDACAADAACHTAFPDLDREFRTLVTQLTPSRAPSRSPTRPVAR
jgi:hypothetical protein